MTGSNSGEATRWIDGGEDTSTLIVSHPSYWRGVKSFLEGLERETVFRETKRLASKSGGTVEKWQKGKGVDAENDTAAM